MVDYLQKDVKLFSDAFNSFVQRGYANGEMINSINEKISKGETLTEQEQTYKDNLINSRTFRSEMGAIMSEQLLGSETFIDNIVSQESSIAEKVMKKIKDLKGMFERLGNAEARAEYKRLAKAEKLYLKAIEKAGYKYRNGKILVRGKKEEIDSTSQNEYNNREIQSSKKESALWESLTKQEQTQLYQRIDALHHSNYVEYRLRNGNYFLDIENKVIETNGNFDSPSVEGYVEFNKFSSKISIARDYFYDQVNNGRTIRESVEYINEVCQEEVATLHGYDDSQNNRVVGEQGRNNKSNRENSGRNGRGRKGTQSNKRAVRYNFELREITYSDGTTTKFSLKETQINNLEKRGIKGDALLDCINLAEEIFSVGGEITPTAKVVLYNATSKENASKIRETGKMYGKEPNLYFSTKSDGVIKDYGDSVVRVEIPLEKLKINDLFYDEAHLTMEVKPYKMTSIKFSKKNSLGEQLTKEQIEFFKDSKVVDNQGRLLVVYHGTENKFTIFNKLKVGKNAGSMWGEGFYFSPYEEIAGDYGEVGQYFRC